MTNQSSALSDFASFLRCSSTYQRYFPLYRMSHAKASLRPWEVSPSSSRSLRQCAVTTPVFLRLYVGALPPRTWSFFTLNVMTWSLWTSASLSSKIHLGQSPCAGSLYISVHLNCPCAPYAPLPSVSTFAPRLLSGVTYARSGPCVFFAILSCS